MERADTILKRIEEQTGQELIITKRKLKRVELIQMVRSAREENRQEVGFSARPFVLCGLPIKRPKRGELEHVRKNGRYFLRIVGDPKFGLPFGQDRLIPLWVATVALRTNSPEVLFNSGAEILDAFGLPKDGKKYRRLVEGFTRVYTSTFYFGPVEHIDSLTTSSRRNYFDELRLWYSREIDQSTLPGDFVNKIVLSPWFWEELKAHPIPVDFKVVKGLADSPGALDFYVWVCWRCWSARRTDHIPLFGPGGLVNQLGVSGYATKRKFRQTLKRWIAVTSALWPGCPASISDSGEYLIVKHAKAIKPATEDLPGLPV